MLDVACGGHPPTIWDTVLTGRPAPHHALVAIEVPRSAQMDGVLDPVAKSQDRRHLLDQIEGSCRRCADDPAASPPSRGVVPQEVAMTDDKIALQDLLEKSSDASFCCASGGHRAAPG